jgi:hypothetical protein
MTDTNTNTKRAQRQIHLTAVDEKTKADWKAQAEKEGFRTLSAFISWVINKHIKTPRGDRREVSTE